MSRALTKRDQAVAEAVTREATLMCAASGCPSIWTVDGGSGRLCTAHAWVPRHRWQEITQGLLDAETDRAMAAQFARPEPFVEPMTFAEKRSLMQRLRSVFAQPKNPRAWLVRLREKAKLGEPLTEGQRHALTQTMHVVAEGGFDE